MPKKTETAEKQQQAKDLYKQGMKLVEIAEALNVNAGTVRRWKCTQKWDADNTATTTLTSHAERSQNRTNKSERSLTAQNNPQKGQQDIVKKAMEQTLTNDDLSPEQQLFCLLYAKTYNAVQSYISAYNTTNYNAAGVSGYRLLKVPKIRKVIQDIKKAKAEQLLAGKEDIVELQMRIAFADIGQYLEFREEEQPVIGAFGPVQTEENGKKKILMQKVNNVHIKDSKSLDTQLIQEIKNGKNGFSIKLADRTKALEWLSKYFEVFPEDIRKAEYEKYRKELDNRKLDIELLKMEMNTKAETEKAEYAENDNFLDAFNSSSSDVWETYMENEQKEQEMKNEQIEQQEQQHEYYIQQDYEEET